MSKNINIHNASGHDQEFEVHGWNNNQNIVVGAGTTWVINAPDGSSGAIIAVHDGHEGEQAEITKNGWGGNDYIDISNIVGAGGNMTVMQVNDISTLKGDPRFMQDMNNAWHNADQGTRDRLSNCVHLDGNGNVARIDAIKDNPGLEDLVRTFADGQTYIGVGAWQGSVGHDSDNQQSSAAHGNQDLLVTYSDDNAYPGADGMGIMNMMSMPMTLGKKDDKVTIPPFTMFSAVPKTEAPTLDLPTDAEAENTFSAKEVATPGGPGIVLTNRSGNEQEYFFFDNYWNGNGTAGANFDHAGWSARLGAGQSQFISLPTSFKGRVQRGTQIPATWVEFQICADNDQAAHGDISLEQGCDGAATIAATDGSGRINGFTEDVLSEAPQEAFMIRPGDGARVLASTMGNWLGGPNQAAIDWLNQRVGQKRAYVVGGEGCDDVASGNQCLAVDFY